MSYQNAMKYVAPGLAAALLILIAAWAFNLPPVSALTERGSEPLELTLQPSGQITDLPYDVVQVSGQGTATGTPDLVQLRLIVEVTKDTVAEAWDTAAQTTQEVRKALTDNGVQENDIVTYRIRIDPDYDYGPDGRMHIGYMAVNSLNVTVRDTDTVGTVLDEAVKAGRDHIQLNRFDFQFSDTDALEQKAREAAVENMQTKAQQIAESSGRVLGDLKVVSEFPIAATSGGYSDYALLAYAESAYDTPVSVGDEAVSVVVYGVYELRR